MSQIDDMCTPVVDTAGFTAVFSTIIYDITDKALYCIFTVLAFMIDSKPHAARQAPQCGPRAPFEFI